MQKPARTERIAIGSPDTTVPEGTVRVWDPFVRIFHWTLALAIGTAWLSAGRANELHQWAGFGATAMIGLRLIWGFWGSEYALFSQFVRSPAQVLSYLRSMANGHEVRFLGHNPAGGAMILTLILAIPASVLSGWLMTTDAFFGVAWVGTLHSLIVHGLALLVFLHLAGVLIASVRHKENLVIAMISGRKRLS